MEGYPLTGGWIIMDESILQEFLKKITNECGIISSLFIIAIVVLLKVIKTLWDERREAIETMMNIKGLADRTNDIVVKITTMMEYNRNNRDREK